MAGRLNPNSLAAAVILGGIILIAGILKQIIRRL
jgi:hypothetical protein